MLSIAKRFLADSEHRIYERVQWGDDDWDDDDNDWSGQPRSHATVKALKFPGSSSYVAVAKVLQGPDGHDDGTQVVSTDTYQDINPSNPIILPAASLGPRRRFYIGYFRRRQTKPVWGRRRFMDASDFDGIGSASSYSGVYGDYYKCEPAGGSPTYRVHCCDHTYADKFPPAKKEYYKEYNYNCDKDPEYSSDPNVRNEGPPCLRATEPKTYNLRGSGAARTLTFDNYAYLYIGAVMDLQIRAQTVIELARTSAGSSYGELIDQLEDKNLANVLVPTGVEKFMAYVHGAVDFQAQATLALQSGTWPAGTVQAPLYERNNLFELEIDLGIPILLKFDLGIQGVVKNSGSSLTFNNDLVGYIKLTGELKLGGTYTENSASGGTDIHRRRRGHFRSIAGQRAALSAKYKFPAWEEVLPEVAGSLTISVVPTLYITVNDLVPLEFQFSGWTSIDFGYNALAGNSELAR